jgi:hypothetical protein
MAWIEPLELETWFVNVFSGSFQLFTGIALFVIILLAGYFRMAGITLLMMIGLFFIMFKDYVDINLFILLAFLMAYLVGFWLRKVITRP